MMRKTEEEEERGECEEKKGNSKGRVEEQVHSEKGEEERMKEDFSSSESSTFSDGEEDNPPFIRYLTNLYSRFFKQCFFFSRRIQSRHAKLALERRNPSCKSQSRKLSSGYDLSAVCSSSSENKDFIQ